MTVRVHDVSVAALERGSASVESANAILERLGVIQRGRPEPVTFHTDLETACRDAELVVETVPENEALKAKVLRQIESAVGSATIIASDTSGIPITTLQAHVSHAERFIGMHWSNPPHLIPVVEVIAGSRTATSTVDTMMAMVRNLDLLPVRIQKDVPGFVENRILYALLREAIDLVETGVIGLEELDTCVSWGIGYKLAVIGPMALLDMAGLDIYHAVASYLNPQLSARGDVGEHERAI
jgi:3-hydroxybutyryl-CoA dehydrogenase/5-formyl-3-hydroxy-2-methylpyridine 4-carboxylate dehydrogenase